MRHLLLPLLLLACEPQDYGLGMPDPSNLPGYDAIAVDIDVALQRAISRLLATPDVPAEVRLTSHVRSYHYADPQLEALTAAQKQLLRMGPRNEKLVKDKLRAILNALGFEERM